MMKPAILPSSTRNGTGPRWGWHRGVSAGRTPCPASLRSWAA